MLFCQHFWCNANGKADDMKTKRTRYQQGTIDKVPRANGWAWRVRFSEITGGKRRQRALYFSGQEYR